MPAMVALPRNAPVLETRSVNKPEVVKFVSLSSSNSPAQAPLSDAKSSGGIGSNVAVAILLPFIKTCTRAFEDATAPVHRTKRKPALGCADSATVTFAE